MEYCRYYSIFLIVFINSVRTRGCSSTGGTSTSLQPSDLWTLDTFWMERLCEEIRHRGRGDDNHSGAVYF